MVLPENESQEIIAHFGVRERLWRSQCGCVALAVWQEHAVELLWGLTLCNAPSTAPKLGTGEALLETVPVGNTLWLGGCFTLK